MNFILWLIFGGLAGWIASMVVGDDAQMGLVANIIIGVIGAFIGGFLADKMGVGGQPGAERPTSVKSFVIAVIGAIVLLVILNLIF
jgi:uncharacterized membrane protein YeaQ/YmgE (transglycosylase-associated protein family)